MRKKTVVCCLLSVLLIGDTNTDIAQKASELNKVRSDIDAAKQAMQRLFRQKSTLQNRLSVIEKQYGETASILKTLISQIEQQQHSLIRLQQDITLKQQKITQQNPDIAGHAKAVYLIGASEQLRLLLNQQNPALSSRMMVYYRYLRTQRSEKVAAMTASVKSLAEFNAQQQRETEQLTHSQTQQENQQLALNAQTRERDELLNQLNHDASFGEQQLILLKESEGKLKDLIASLQKNEPIATIESIPTPAMATLEKPIDDDASYTAEFAQLNAEFASLKGKLPWPVKGSVMQKFGSARADSVWNGVLINAKEGSNIRSVSQGKVAFADWLNGYGLLIIIEHGKDFMTLYAFNQSIYKKVGETVNAGDIIAAVGQSDGRSQAGLYFEIRRTGTPIDPSEWCKKLKHTP